MNMEDDPFEKDDFPGKPRILFIGLPNSSHTHSWIDLLSDSGYNIRVFSSSDGFPPQDWKVRVYITSQELPGNLAKEYRKTLHPLPSELDGYTKELNQYHKEIQQYDKEMQLYYMEVHEYLLGNFPFKLMTFAQRVINIFARWFTLPTVQNDLQNFQSRFRQKPHSRHEFHRQLPAVPGNPPLIPASKADSPVAWLAQIIHQWQPDVIDTLGIFDGQGGELYYETLINYNLEGLGKWVLELRGGSDLTLRRNMPEIAPRLSDMLAKSHVILSDNKINVEYAGQLGIPSEKFASIVPVPGAGGIDIEKFVQVRSGQPSSRRLILVPKAYECIWSKMAPVFESFRLAWQHIQPCEIIFLAMNLEARSYYYTLPQNIRDHCRVYERIPRAEVLNLMGRARVILAPSLVDGVPMVLYEAMAAGALPIVSPIETLKPLFENGKHVLFARNLYPEEIASSLVRAMTDDVLVDSVAETNLELVNLLANKDEIKKKVTNFYDELLK